MHEWGVPFKYFFFFFIKRDAHVPPKFGIERVSVVLWSPRPPRFLGLHMGDQDLRHVGFFLMLEPSYQKFLRMESILEHRLLGLSCIYLLYTN